MTDSPEQPKWNPAYDATSSIFGSETTKAILELVRAVVREERQQGGARGRYCYHCRYFAGTEQGRAPCTMNPKSEQHYWLDDSTVKKEPAPTYDDVRAAYEKAQASGPDLIEVRVPKGMTREQVIAIIEEPLHRQQEQQPEWCCLDFGLWVDEGRIEKRQVKAGQLETGYYLCSQSNLGFGERKHLIVACPFCGAQRP